MLPPSVYATPLRTCPFSEDQLRAFRRDYQRHPAPALRLCPFAQPQFPAYQARVTQAFEQARGACTGQGLSLWA